MEAKITGSLVKKRRLKLLLLHKVANGSRRRNAIVSIQSKGVVLETKMRLRWLFMTFINPSLAKKFNIEYNLIGKNYIQRWGAGDLEVPFSEHEIREAIFYMAGDKAPGPDGFLALFFQEFWDIVKGELMDLFSEFIKVYLNWKQ